MQLPFEPRGRDAPPFAIITVEAGRHSMEERLARNEQLHQHLRALPVTIPVHLHMGTNCLHAQLIHCMRTDAIFTQLERIARRYAHSTLLFVDDLGAAFDVIVDNNENAGRFMPLGPFRAMLEDEWASMWLQDGEGNAYAFGR